jgi:O-acetyl-ADP-ribose deacetylase (regulator of RNase III)
MIARTPTIWVGSPLEARAEALVRPVNAQLEGVTAWSREVEQLESVAHLDPRGVGADTLPAGAVLLTPARVLPFSFLLHAVVVVPEAQGVSALVERALQNVFRRSQEWGIQSLVLPLLGVGPGQMPWEEGAERLAHALIRALPAPPDLVIPVGTEAEGALLQAVLEAQGLKPLREGP